MRKGLLCGFFLLVKVGGLTDEGVHLTCVDLGGWGVIDKGDGCAVVVGGSLARGSLHGISDFGSSVSVAEHVDITVVETDEDDDLGVHHGGDETEELGLEAGVVDFKVGLHGLAAEGALGGVLQLAHVAGAVDVVEALSVDHHDVALQHSEVLVGGSVGRQLGKCDTLSLRAI